MHGRVSVPLIDRGFEACACPCGRCDSEPETQPSSGTNFAVNSMDKAENGAKRTERHATPEPRVHVAQAGCAASGAGWRIVWRITNLTDSGLRLLDARCPHGQFRGPLMELDDVQVAPSESTALEAVVACRGRHGDVVENAFLIATAEWRGHRWRILARFTVRFATDGSPSAATELVTAQRVGFSRPERQASVSDV